jgi:hypothetical protein
MGKLTINMINSKILHDIVKIISLNLPEGFEFIAGSRIENIHLYYNFV